MILTQIPYTRRFPALVPKAPLGREREREREREIAKGKI